MAQGSAMTDPRSEDWVPRPGTVIDGRYQVESLVGNGTMGAVVAARHLVLHRSVAIKLLRPERAVDPVALERFRQEASAASRIRSDHVVRIHDVGATDRAIPFMAMELLEGIDLEKLAERGPLPLQLAADCILQAAEALAEAHASGIVHRDIKPSNLFLTERADGSPLLKVLDFGISKLAPERGGDPSLTATQAVIGSPAYMAPEQIRASKYVTSKADVWALAVVLFEVLTTKLPFDGETVGSVLAAVATLPPRSLRALRPDVPEQVELTVLACLEKDPTARATLGDLAAGLLPFASPMGAVSAERAIRICGTSAAIAGPSERRGRVEVEPSSSPRSVAPAPGLRMSPALVATIGAGAVALIATTIAIVILLRSRPEEPLPDVAAATASAPTPIEAPASVQPTAAPAPTVRPTVSSAPASTRRAPTRHPKPRR